MSRGLFWLNDQQWAAIEPFMPRNKLGARRKDDRCLVSGIFHVLKSGCRWLDCPEEYGPPTTVYNRFNRWSRKVYGLEFWRRWPLRVRRVATRYNKLVRNDLSAVALCALLA